MIPFPGGDRSSGRGGKGGRPSGGGRPGFPAGEMAERWFAVLFSGVMALIFWTFPLVMALNVLFGVVFAYWAFVHHQAHQTYYFRRNWGLLLLILVIMAVLNPMHLIIVGALALVYWLLVLRQRSGPSSFLRYHMLCSLTSGVLIALAGVLLSSMLALLITLAKIATLSPMVLALSVAQTWVELVAAGLMTAVVLLLIPGALTGSTPRIPFISSQVTYWA